MSTNVIPELPDLPDGYFYEIGRIVVSWNRLESLVLHASVITLLGGFAKDGRAIAALTHMAFPQKLQSLEAMLRIADEEIAKTYCESVRGLLTQAADKRNALLHQPWFLEPDGVKRLGITARGTLKFAFQSVSLQELVATSEFINDAYGKLLVSVALPLGAKHTPQQGQ